MSDNVKFENWQLEIGKLILACARVEYELLRLYSIWIPERNYHDDRYKIRYNRAIKVTKQILGENHSIVSELIEMKSYANFRHIIAHNPVHYSNEYNEWRIIDLKNNSASIEYSDLKELARKADLNSIKLSANLRINVRENID